LSWLAPPNHGNAKFYKMAKNITPPQSPQPGTQNAPKNKFPFNTPAGYAAGYAGSGAPSSTQDKDDPVIGNEEIMANPALYIRTIDRSPKDALTLQTSIIAAESVYYPNQQRLFDLYEEVLRDAFLRGIINKRISQVVNKNVLALRNDQEVPELTKLIKSREFKDLMREILWTKMWGINGIEFIPGKRFDFNLIPKKHIKIKTQKITFEQFGLDDGIDYTQLRNIWILGDRHIIGGNGSSHDLGLLMICSFLVLLKKGVISDWAQYIQIFGSPALIVKYLGIDRDAKAAAEEILNNLGGGNRLAAPKEMDINFEDGKTTNGDGALQDTFRRSVNEELSIFILGNTETTGHSGTGTGAKSRTHSEQQLEIIKDDMDYISDNLNSDHFLSILQSYGYDVTGVQFQFDKEVDIAYLEKKYPVDIALATAGLKIPTKYLYETYAIPEPEDGDDVLEYTAGNEDENAAQGPPKTPGKIAKSKPKPKALTAAGVQAIVKETMAASLKDFFAQPS